MKKKEIIEGKIIYLFIYLFISFLLYLCIAVFSVLKLQNNNNRTKYNQKRDVQK